MRKKFETQIQTLQSHEEVLNRELFIEKAAREKEVEELKSTKIQLSERLISLRKKYEVVVEQNHSMMKSQN